MRRHLRALKRRILPPPPPPPALLVPPPPPPPYPMVSLYSWAPDDGRRNFGDHLSRIIVAAVAAERGFTLEDETPAATTMLAVGSILHFARDGDVIWGSGVNGKVDPAELKARALDIRAVRGPKTAAVLSKLGMTVPAVYGDPALLVPRYFGQRFRRPDRRESFIVLPNLHDLTLIEPAPHVVSPLWGWNRCIERILGADMVVASSLHGLILAEAFGIPARMLRLSDTESTFKYDDYAQGTGRPKLRFARSVARALDMGGDTPAVFDGDALAAAFPFDLWEGGGRAAG